MKEQIEAILEEQVRPFLAMHGGNVELVDIEESKVKLRLSGGCQGCASSTATLKDGIETILKEAIPEITEVEDVTDHAMGSNPYF